MERHLICLSYALQEKRRFTLVPGSKTTGLPPGSQGHSQFATVLTAEKRYQEALLLYQVGRRQYIQYAPHVI